MKLTPMQQATQDCIIFDIEQAFEPEDETQEPEVDWTIAWQPYSDPERK